MRLSFIQDLSWALILIAIVVGTFYTPFLQASTPAFQAEQAAKRAEAILKK